MSEVITYTTSDSDMLEASQRDAGSDTTNSNSANGGYVDLSLLLSSTREYSKRLPSAIDSASSESKSDDGLTFGDDEATRLQNEQFLEQRYARVHRVLGRGALARAVKGTDRFLTRATTRIESTKEDWDNANAYYAEKYANKDDDNWLTRKWNAFRRNKLKVIAYGPAAALGGFALSRPFAADLASDAVHHATGAFNHVSDGVKDIGDEVYRTVVGPRKVSMGEGQELAANAINMTPVVHDKQTKVYIMGGHTQGLAHESGYAQSLDDSGAISKGDDVRALNWRAEMGMPGESITMIEADTLGGAQVADAIRDSGGEKVRFEFFSQSTQAGLRGLNEAHAQGVDLSNVEVVLNGGPSGDLGLGKNQNISIARPFLSAAELEIDQPIPPGVKVTIRTDIADVFGNGGNQSLLTLGAMAVGPGHLPVGPENSVLISSYQKDGVNYEIWGPKDGINHPITRALKVQGIPITPEAEALANAAAPITMPGQATQYPDGPDVISKAGAAADSYVPGSNGAFQAAANSALANPQFNALTREVDDLVPLLDKVGRINPNDPIGAINTIQSAMKEGGDVLQSVNQMLQNPAKALNIAVDVANAGINQAGGPAIIPRFDENWTPPAQAAAPAWTPPAAPAAPAWTPPVAAPSAPAWTPPVAEAAPAWTPPATPVVEAPAPVYQPTPPPMPAWTPPAAPAPGPASYAPVGDLFSNSSSKGQYASVGPLFS